MNTISGSERCLDVRKLYIMSMKAHASVEYWLKMNVLIPEYPSRQISVIEKQKCGNLVKYKPENGFDLM